MTATATTTATTTTATTTTDRQSTAMECSDRTRRFMPQPKAETGTAMTTVYVVTAGSGDTYRIERVYLDRDQAYKFAQDYNGIAPVEPVQVEEWGGRGPTGRLRGAEWWARVPVNTGRGMWVDVDAARAF